MLFSMLVVFSGLAATMGPVDEAGFPVFKLENAVQQPDFSKLPSFSTGNAEYDAFANEYFMRYLSVDERGIYWNHPPVAGTVDMLWTIEWDLYFFPWIDRSAMGTGRQSNDPHDAILNTLVRVPVDKHGYVWGSRLVPEDNNAVGGYRPLYGWPWPKYTHNDTTKERTGWEFNDANDGTLARLKTSGVNLAPQYDNCQLKGTIAASNGEIVFPAIDVDVFQVPIIELDLSYFNVSPEDGRKLVRGMRIYWTTDRHPEYSDERSVGAEDSELPPEEFPQYYSSWHMTQHKTARFPLYFAMCQHPQWGREDRRITGLKLVPAKDAPAGAEFAVNYLRATYDVRLTTTNATLIRATNAFFQWSGNERLLTTMMPRLRKAAIFMTEHLKGRRKGLIDTSYFAGKDGLGGLNTGRGMIGSYWDLLPAGRFDLESSVMYAEAMRAMAELEEAAEKRGLQIPQVGVLGPNNRSPILYDETPKSLRKKADRAIGKINKTFWSKNTERFVRNVDVNKNRHDYGFLFENLHAVAAGVGTNDQCKSILTWLDGARSVENDNSQGNDIYHWRFAPRTTTKRNNDYYFWPWVVGMKENLPIHQYGNQMQDGGGLPATSYFDMLVRARLGQADQAYARTLEMKKWYDDVKAAGGNGPEFFRAYYNGHPERGLLQGGGPPGGLGLDREFLSDAAMGSAFIPTAFLGLSASEDGTLNIAPAIPKSVSHIAAAGIAFRGAHLRIEAGHGYLAVNGDVYPDNTRIRLCLRNIDNLKMNGVPMQVIPSELDTCEVVVPLKSTRMEWNAKP